MKSLFLFFASLALATITPAQTISDDDIVRSSYPDRLVRDFAESAEEGETVPFLISHSRLDIDGQSHILAAYSNGASAAVRLLRVQNSSPIVVAEQPEGLALSGTDPALQLLDLDSDGRPEAIVTLRLMHHRESWVFAISAGALRLLGPSRQNAGMKLSDATNAEFVDIDGDARTELLVPPSRFDENQTYKIYQLGPDGFRPTVTQLVLHDRFVRTTAEPDEYETTFSATAGQKYVLRLINGDSSGKNPVTSAVVRINGTVIVGPQHFKPKQRVTEVSFQVQASNTLLVEVAGAPQSELRLIIVHPKS